ncbi:MAG TPA: hypothetical protein VMU75_16005 [Acidimicrobiales bacterium]|nr:hypothetical protein [Acidimicrobiales bacterium]
MVEAVVALFLLALVMVPVTRLAITTTGVSNSMHLRLEAADLASQKLAYVAYNAEQGQQWSQGVTSDTESSGTDRFNVSVDVEPVNASVLCHSGGVPQAWSAQATVSWGGGSATSQVAAGNYIEQSTIIPAPQSQGTGSGNGEIAIPVYQPSGPLETAQPVSITVTGACTGSSCPAQPYPSGPPYATETVSTGTSGCAVFTGLYADSGWTYTASVTNSNGYVDPSERSTTGTGASAPALATTLTATAGTISTPAGGAGFTLAPAATVQVQFQMTNFTGVTGSPSSASAAVLPVTVNSNSPGLSCPTLGCTLGDGISSFNGQQSAQLFPVSAASGNNYLGWAGGSWGFPSPTVYGSTAGPTYFNSASGVVQLPVYPLTFKVTLKPGVTSVDFTATPVGTTTPLALNPASGTSTATMTTGLPLGQYQITATPPLASSEYVWITPAGVCSATSAAGTASSSSASQPCASPSTTAIGVSLQ